MANKNRQKYNFTSTATDTFFSFIQFTLLLSLSGVKENISELIEYAGGFLVTFVEREGRMAGIDLSAIREIVQQIQDSPFASSTQLTIAGGITTVEDLAALDALGVEGQVVRILLLDKNLPLVLYLFMLQGMALYTGRIGLAEGMIASLKSDRADGLFPTLVTDVV